jgi:hypothetical protein
MDYLKGIFTSIFSSDDNDKEADLDPALYYTVVMPVGDFPPPVDYLLDALHVAEDALPLEDSDLDIVGPFAYIVENVDRILKAHKKKEPVDNEEVMKLLYMMKKMVNEAKKPLKKDQ